MLVAQLNGRLIEADQIDSQSKTKKLAYVCPQCHQPVIFKHGHCRIAHFSHLSRTACPFSENESQIHLAGKLRLKTDMLALGYSAVLERIFPQIDQRADVFVPDLETVLEYQCSPISFDSIKRRTQGYLKVAKRVIWILGPRYESMHYQYEMIAKFAKYHRQLGFYFICYLEKEGYFRLHFQLREMAGKLIGETQNFLNLAALLAYLKRPPRSVQPRLLGQKTVRRQLLKQLQQIQRCNLTGRRTYLPAVTDCYTFQKLFIGCPLICHGNRTGNLPIFRRSILCWRVWLMLRLFDGSRLTLSDHLLAGLFEISYDQFKIDFAQISDSKPFFKAEFRQFLIQLHDQGYLRQTVTGIQILKWPVWFTDYDQKRLFIMTAPRLL